MTTLPNGKPIDMDMLETAMEDSDLANSYFLNLVTGKVAFFSEYVGLSNEDEQLLEDIDGSDDYVAVERIPSHEAYQWMADFVDEMVAPADEHAAEKLSIALNGKGAFRRFKDTLHDVDDQWLQAWYQWRDKQLKAAVAEWLKSVLSNEQRQEEKFRMLSPSDLSQIRGAAAKRTEAVAELARRICEVPAPTGNEWERARLVASLWREQGYEPEIDAIGNVYIRRGKRENGPVLMLLAHTDTVFPQTTPISVERQGDILRGPGIGDNSVSVAAMISTLGILDELEQECDTDIVAVANVGEEGLGNLLGSRAAVERYRERLGAVIAIDGNLGNLVHAAVGSKRWRITVSGPGGHSFGNFGTPSAIHSLGRIIAAIAQLEVPQQPKTTFNVGLIEGGTSINTIAAQATALLDLRSTDITMLNQVADQVRGIIEQSAGPDLRTEIDILGERPAGMRSKADPLVQLAAEAITWLGMEPKYEASSTDANIPISLNIPAVCIGITQVKRAHTLEEFLYVPPIGEGLAQLTRLCIEACTLIANT